MSVNLLLVSLGPGDIKHMTGAARQALEDAELIVGLENYIDSLPSELLVNKHVERYAIGQEYERANYAVSSAQQGKRVALVGSGDIGVYGLAALAISIAIDKGVNFMVVPGVTAAVAAASLVGAPLCVDFACISLSDLLVSWDEIERRLKLLLDADLALAIYNPSSTKRKANWIKAVSLIKESKPSYTPVAIVRNAFRSGQSVAVGDVRRLDTYYVDMNTIVIIGSNRTVQRNGFIYALRDWSITDGRKQA